MGIRFYCPNGHKLNVKSFLAGQRGVCPRCGVKTDIPYESTREKGSKDLPIAEEWEERARQEGRYPFSAADSPGGSDKNPENINLNAISPAQAPAPEVENPLAAMRIPRPMFPADAGYQNPPPPPPVAPRLPDPFADAPDAVWYVRIASGEQYGPVKAMIVRQWLAERRIIADTLVWREGWSEWKAGSAVFESLAGEKGGGEFLGF